ncbi:coiled-coil-helix-coiled-coil-helix domain-containing protein [Rhodotorula paludigena]|uniref:coiled-coil-helix-coiled-coil-helix domain-containing protein n=1 Tax=Rhodotorula paludigena TaxID=86838 RepID=UPI00317631F5
MSTHRDALFPSKDYVDPTPMPAGVPKVDELGTTSAPLKSASFFIGEYCKPYNEDFMLCKAENRDPAHCLQEGRKVTRCAQDLIAKVRSTCLKEFDAHWQCLERNNQEFYLCRKEEKVYNGCVFEKLKLKKDIPGSPEGQPQIHEKSWPIYGAIQK